MPISNEQLQEAIDKVEEKLKFCYEECYYFCEECKWSPCSKVKEVL